MDGPDKLCGLENDNNILGHLSSSLFRVQVSSLLGVSFALKGTGVIPKMNSHHFYCLPQVSPSKSVILSVYTVPVSSGGL
jgi:hypothetical protein